MQKIIAPLSLVDNPFIAMAKIGGKLIENRYWLVKICYRNKADIPEECKVLLQESSVRNVINVVMENDASIKSIPIDKDTIPLCMSMRA